MSFILAAFALDVTKAGGSSFIEIVTGVNLAFVAWDRFQERLKFVDRDCRNIVRQVCASIMDEEHRHNSEDHFHRMLSDVDGLYKWLWLVCYCFGLLCVAFGFLMLYCDWKCQHDYLLLLPILVYLIISGLIWFVFRRRCKIHCKALIIANGKGKITSDSQEVDEMAKGLEMDLYSRTVPPVPQVKAKTSLPRPSAKKTAKKRPRQ